MIKGYRPAYKTESGRLGKFKLLLSFKLAANFIQKAVKIR